MEGNTGHKVFQTQFGEYGDLKNFTMCRFYKYETTKHLFIIYIVQLHQKCTRKTQSDIGSLL